MAINNWWAGDSLESYWMEVTDRDDLGGELWAPRTNAIGGESWSYSLVSHVQPGDRIFHWSKAERAIVGWSEAVGPLYSDTRSWQARGVAGRTRGVPSTGETWVMPLRGLHLLKAPVTRDALNAELYDDVISILQATEKAVGEPAYAPFQHYGGREIRAQQGYLTKFPAALVAFLFPAEPVAQLPADQAPQSQRPGRTRGQGYLSDAALRSAVEKRAVEAAKEHYLALGASEITELGKPFDLRVLLHGEERRVEVKGSTVPQVDAVELTRNEVNHALQWEAMDLVIVSGISVKRDDKGGVVASGGTLRKFSNWAPLDRHLRPTRFRYQLPQDSEL